MLCAHTHSMHTSPRLCHRVRLAMCCAHTHCMHTSPRLCHRVRLAMFCAHTHSMHTSPRLCHRVRLAMCCAHTHSMHTSPRLCHRVRLAMCCAHTHSMLSKLCGLSRGAVVNSGIHYGCLKFKVVVCLRLAGATNDMTRDRIRKETSLNLDICR